MRAQAVNCLNFHPAWLTRFRRKGTPKEFPRCRVERLHRRVRVRPQTHQLAAPDLTLGRVNAHPPPGEGLLQCGEEPHHITRAACHQQVIQVGANQGRLRSRLGNGRGEDTEKSRGPRGSPCCREGGHEETKGAPNTEPSTAKWGGNGAKAAARHQALRWCGVTLETTTAHRAMRAKAPGHRRSSRPTLVSAWRSGSGRRERRSEHRDGELQVLTRDGEATEQRARKQLHRMQDN